MSDMSPSRANTPPLTTAIPYDLTTSTGVLSYLAHSPTLPGKGFESISVTRMTGGYCNFVYRLQLCRPVDDGKCTAVLKHAETWLSGSVDPDGPSTTGKTEGEGDSGGSGGWEFDLARQEYEVEALRRVRSWCQSRANNSEVGSNVIPVTVPEVYLWDKENNAIIMEDVGSNALSLAEIMNNSDGELCPFTLTPALSRQCGMSLGRFLGGLHVWGKSDEELLDFFSGNEIGKTVTANVTYERLVSTLSGERGEDYFPVLHEPPLNITVHQLEAIANIANERAKAVRTFRETFTMGDFWPGNIMIALGDRQSSHEMVSGGHGDAVKKIYVLDWELSKAGAAAMDVGRFVAEMSLVAKFRDPYKDHADCLMRGFVTGYKDALGLNGAGMGGGSLMRRDVMIHVGAHFVTWTPRTGWKGDAKVRETVVEGVNYLLYDTCKFEAL